MISLALLGTALFLFQGQASFDTDTTVSVQQGTRLRISNQGGDIVVRAWDRNQLRVRAAHSSRSRVTIDVQGAVAEVSARGRTGMSGMVDYEVTAPAWMALDLGGMYAEVTIEGTRAPVKVQTLEGNITLRGGAESITLNTVNGRIDVSGARGRVELHAVSEGIVVSDVRGDVTAETVSGDIELRGIDAKMVDVQTVSGDLVYDGRIVEGGSYSLLTHSGEITVAIPEGANATIGVATASGDIVSNLNLTADRKTRRRQTFRIGSGSANVDLETFSGDVSLVRPGEVPAAVRHQEDDEDDEPRHRRQYRSRRNPPGGNSDDLDLDLDHLDEEDLR
jgi:DUF4097 and DUF4098 domain-containing protein YvlB